jgi:electron transfer flavoprotein beta subunit
VSAPELHALEAALAVRDDHAARVTALALGPLSCCEPLREALYRGADEALLLSDPRMTGSDPLAAGYILGCAVRTIAPDIVVCPARTAGGDAASIGVQAAVRAGIASISSVDRPVEIDGRTIRARRDTGAGWELLSASLPVLVTVTNAANTPRPPAMKRMMKFKKAKSIEENQGAGADARRDALEAKGLLIRTWSLDDIGADPARCGAAGSPTRIERAQSFASIEEGGRVFENSREGIARLLEALFEDRTL